MRIPGFDWVPIPGGRDGIPRWSGAGSYPWRIIFHTTEGGSIGTNLRTYANTGFYPHFTVDIGSRVAQHVDTDLSVTASSNVPGDGVETNTLRCLQVEMCGYAREMPNLSEANLKWLGEKFLAPLVRAHKISLQCVDFVNYPASYGPGAPQRMSPQEWLHFAGSCGHQHIPGDSHGDPGGINMDRICYHARQIINPTDDPVQEDQEAMMLEQIGRRYAGAMRPPVVFVDIPTHSLWAVNGANFHGSIPWGNGFMAVVPTSNGGKARIVGLDIAVKRDGDEVARDPDTNDPDRDWTKFRVVDETGAEFVYPWK